MIIYTIQPCIDVLRIAMLISFYILQNIAFTIQQETVKQIYTIYVPYTRTICKHIHIYQYLQCYAINRGTHPVQLMVNYQGTEMYRYYICSHPYHARLATIAIHILSYIRTMCITRLICSLLTVPYFTACSNIAIGRIQLANFLR